MQTSTNELHLLIFIKSMLNNWLVQLTHITHYWYWHLPSPTQHWFMWLIVNDHVLVRVHCTSCHEPVVAMRHHVKDSITSYRKHPPKNLGHICSQNCVRISRMNECLNAWPAKRPYTQSQTELLRVRFDEVGLKELCCRLGTQPLNMTHVWPRSTAPQPDGIGWESILLRVENLSTQRKTLGVRLRATETQPTYDLEVESWTWFTEMEGTVDNH